MKINIDIDLSPTKAKDFGLEREAIGALLRGIAERIEDDREDRGDITMDNGESGIVVGEWSLGDNPTAEKLNTPMYWAISEFTELHKAGKNYLGLCPFHDEKTPSFVLSVQDQRYKCFGCDAEGDLNTFLATINK